MAWSQTIDELNAELSDWIAMIQRGEHDTAWESFIAYEQAQNDPVIHAALRSLYADQPLLDLGPHGYACVVHPADTNGGHLEAALQTPVDQLEAASDFGLPRYREFLMHHAAVDRKLLYNGRVFAMTRMTCDPPMLRCRPQRYFRVLETDEAIKYELWRAWRRSGGALRDAAALWSALPLRAMLHRRVADPVHDGRQRGAGLASSTLIAFEYEGRPHGLLRRVSARKVAGNAGQYHVIPAAMMEYYDSPTDGSYSLLETVLREYAEELFNIEPTEGEADPLWHRRTEPVQQLLRWLQTGGATLRFTGLTVDLITLRPELCTLLWIHEPTWAEQVYAGLESTWEYDDPAHDRLVPLDVPDAAMDWSGLEPQRIIPPAAAAVALARRFVQR